MASLEDIFAGMAERFDASKAAGVNMTIQFNLSGEGGGQYVAQVADGEASVEPGTADSPTATIGMDAEDYKAMATGKLNAMTAFMTGKVKVDGDLSAVMKMQNVFGL